MREGQLKIDSYSHIDIISEKRSPQNELARSFAEMQLHYEKKTCICHISTQFFTMALSDIISDLNNRAIDNSYISMIRQAGQASSSLLTFCWFIETNVPSRKLPGRMLSSPQTLLLHDKNHQKVLKASAFSLDHCKVSLYR